MKLHPNSDAIGVADFANNAREHSAELLKSGRPLLLAEDGKASMVVMSVEAFSELASAAKEAALDQGLQEALERDANGEEGIPLEAFRERVRNERNYAL